ncbi:hypothetical protein ACFCYX_38835 [Streptomyces populi]|uniref:hypothetical protein n=1 Tax=Streptomyces populi TaxID=2058924 RepID=UPI0013A6ACA1|nr:hypothetical protein [Streptomyces populi]
MDGVSVGTVLTLVGVLLGTTGTLVGQHLATRVEMRRDLQRRVEAERAECKEVILVFLAAAQKVELVLDRRSLGLPTADEPEDQLLHSLWLAEKAVELVCLHEVAQAARRYTEALHQIVRDVAAIGQAPTKRECRLAFVEAARSGLGSDRPQLRQ